MNGLPVSKSLFWTYKNHAMNAWFLYGGEGGIRTLDTLVRYIRFRVWRVRPLCHLSSSAYDADHAFIELLLDSLGSVSCLRFSFARRARKQSALCFATVEGTKIDIRFWKNLSFCSTGRKAETSCILIDCRVFSKRLGRPTIKPSFYTTNQINIQKSKAKSFLK